MRDELDEAGVDEDTGAGVVIVEDNGVDVLLELEAGIDEVAKVV